jgi:hypothetical protein
LDPLTTAALAILNTGTGLFSVASGIHSIVTSIRSGRDAKKMRELIRKQNVKIERLTHDLSIANSIRAVKTLPDFHLDVKATKDILLPIQRAIDEPLLCTSFQKAPDHLSTSKFNIFDSLVHIQPVSKNISNPPSFDQKWVKIYFNAEGLQFFGWQLHGIVNQIFGFELDDSPNIMPSITDINRVPSIDSQNSKESVILPTTSSSCDFLDIKWTIEITGPRGYRHTYHEAFLLGTNALRGAAPRSLLDALTGTGILFSFERDL